MQSTGQKGIQASHPVQDSLTTAMRRGLFFFSVFLLYWGILSYKTFLHLETRPTSEKNTHNIATPLAAVNFAFFAFETLDKLVQEGYKAVQYVPPCPLQGAEAPR